MDHCTRLCCLYRPHRASPPYRANYVPTCRLICPPCDFPPRYRYCECVFSEPFGLDVAAVQGVLLRGRHQARVSAGGGLPGHHADAQVTVAIARHRRVVRVAPRGTAPASVPRAAAGSSRPAQELARAAADLQGSLPVVRTGYGASRSRTPAGGQSKLWTPVAYRAVGGQGHQRGDALSYFWTLEASVLGRPTLGGLSHVNSVGTGQAVKSIGPTLCDCAELPHWAAVGGSVPVELRDDHCADGGVG